MQVDSPDLIRNITLTGHGDTGKTTLASAALYTSGAATRLNRVEDGNTVTDFDAVEIDRTSSIGLATCFAPWRKHKVNIIDTPGLGMFGAEGRAGIRAADTMVLVVNAVSPVQVTTEKMWAYAEEIAQPTLIHVNKLDREHTDFETTVDALRERFGRSVRPIQVPIGKESGFEGMVDLVHRKAYRYTADGDGKAQAAEIPPDLTDLVETLHSKLVEGIAESDEALMERYFEEGDLAPDELTAALQKSILSRQVVPVTIGSAVHGIGTAAFLDAVVDFLPDPTARQTFPATTIGGEETSVATDTDGPMAALVFKTLNDPFSGHINIMRVVRGTLDGDVPCWNSRAEDAEKVGHLVVMQGKNGTAVSRLVTGDIGAVAKLKHTKTGDTLCAKDAPVRLGWIMVREPAISFAIEPKNKGDEDKIGEALHRIMDEDVSLRFGRDPQTGEMLLSGSGQLHVEIAIAKMRNRSKVEVILHPPKVPYRETIKRPADGHGRHKKQSGGRGQFADCKIKMEPIADGDVFEFKDEIFGGSIPQGYRPAVEKGIEEARQRGYLAGFQVGGFRVRLIDGQYHDVDSSEMAFKVAGSLAFKDAMSRAVPTLLEPVMSVEITTTEEFMGDIMSDLSSRRGRPQGMDTQGQQQIVKASVPMAEMLDYASVLRRITQGRSSFSMEFAGYEEVPRQLQEKIVAEAKRAEED